MGWGSLVQAARFFAVNGIGTRVSLKRVFVGSCLAVVICFFQNESVALTMAEAVERALHNDPVYLGIQASLGVSRARADQAFAALLPQLSATANAMRNRREYAQNNARGVPTNILEKYNSDSAQLNLTQPLWHLDSYYAMREADYVAAQADQQLRAAGQDLLVRLAQAWFDIMQARDAVRFAESQAKLASYQLQRAIKARDKGLMSTTDAELARGKSELAAAELAANETRLSLKFAALEQIIGPLDRPVLPEFPEEAAAPEQRSDSLAHWEKLADEHSPDILAARYALDAANDEVLKQYAGHGPKLDIVASYGKSAQGAGLTGGQAGFSSKTTSFGLQLNMPLFSGGEQSAKVREALAQKDKAEQDMELAVRKAHLSVKQAWYGWSSGRSMLAATRLNMKSTAMALTGARRARERDVKSDVDVLKAQTDFDGAVKDARQAQYELLMSYFKLLAGLGKLDGNELIRLERPKVMPGSESQQGS